jgi:hypothetical protein
MKSLIKVYRREKRLGTADQTRTLLIYVNQYSSLTLNGLGRL